MNRYDKMVELNQLLSKEKERRAINALIEMKEEGWISVTELTRRTGSKGWNKLVGPVLLIGTLGYVLGNYYGVLVGNLLR